VVGARLVALVGRGGGFWGGGHDCPSPGCCLCPSPLVGEGYGGLVGREPRLAGVGWGGAPWGARARESAKVSADALRACRHAYPSPSCD